MNTMRRPKLDPPCLVLPVCSLRIFAGAWMAIAALHKAARWCHSLVSAERAVSLLRGQGSFVITTVVTLL
jgi:hypothetical protein